MSPYSGGAERAEPSVDESRYGLEGGNFREGAFMSPTLPTRRNVTGVSILAPELSAKRLDILKQALPSITRVGVLGYRPNPATPEQITAIEEVAASLKLTIHPGYIERPGRYAESFTRFTSERVGAVLVLTDNVLSADRAGIRSEERRVGKECRL